MANTPSTSHSLESLLKALSASLPAGVSVNVQGTPPNFEIKAAAEEILKLWTMDLIIAHPGAEAEDEVADAMGRLAIATDKIGSEA